MAVNEDLKNLNSLIKTMDTQLELLVDVTNSTIEFGFGLDIKMKDIISSISSEDIQNSNEEDFIDYLSSGFSGEGDNQNIISLQERYNKNKDYKDKDFVEYLKYVFNDIKSSLDEIEKMKKERDDLINNVQTVSDQWYAYINSKEYKDKKLNRINELKEKLKLEEDPAVCNKISKMITAMENTESLDFLFERIEKLGDKEIKNIIDIFFDRTRSNLVMKKFADKLPRYGYNNEIYKMFFNLEEKFLPEEYHDLNNIFLFHVMRYIGHTNSDTKESTMYTSSILIKIYNLLYHKYESQDMENEFIEIIKKVDDYFMSYIDIFKEKNITSPLHPARIQRDKEYEEKRRLMIITSLQNEGIEPDTTLSTEELREMLQDVLDKKQNGENIKNEETTEPVEDFMNPPVEDDSEKESEEIPIYKDRYGCYYILGENNTYAYCDENNNIIEEGIAEEVILQLQSTLSIEKSFLKL